MLAHHVASVSHVRLEHCRLHTCHELKANQSHKSITSFIASATKRQGPQALDARDFTWLLHQVQRERAVQLEPCSAGHDVARSKYVGKLRKGLYKSLPNIIVGQAVTYYSNAHPSRNARRYRLGLSRRVLRVLTRALPDEHESSSLPFGFSVEYTLFVFCGLS